MYRDNMIHNNIIWGRRLNKQMKRLGLSKQEIDLIMQNETKSNEQQFTSMGPDEYCGGYYGTISLKDFK